MPETTPADELRTAATTLRVPLPAFIAMPPRIVMGDSETMSALAWCEDHTRWEDGRAPERPDEAACWNCDTAELPHEEMAETIRRLLAARGPLAALLDDVARFIGEVTTEPPANHIVGLALATARQINAAKGGHRA